MENDIRAQLEEERRIIKRQPEFSLVYETPDWEVGGDDFLAGINITACDPLGFVEREYVNDGFFTFAEYARTTLPLRNAQLEAVLELCDPNFNLSIPDHVKRRFKHAIEEVWCDG